jgi:hypothetical protein
MNRDRVPGRWRVRWMLLEQIDSVEFDAFFEQQKAAGVNCLDVDWKASGRSPMASSERGAAQERNPHSALRALTGSIRLA